MKCSFILTVFKVLLSQTDFRLSQVQMIAFLPQNSAKYEESGLICCVKSIFSSEMNILPQTLRLNYHYFFTSNAMTIMHRAILLKS